MKSKTNEIGWVPDEDCTVSKRCKWTMLCIHLDCCYLTGHLHNMGEQCFDNLTRLLRTKMPSYTVGDCQNCLFIVSFVMYVIVSGLCANNKRCDNKFQYVQIQMCHLSNIIWDSRINLMLSLISWFPEPQSCTIKLLEMKTNMTSKCSLQKQHYVWLVDSDVKVTTNYMMSSTGQATNPSFSVALCIYLRWSLIKCVMGRLC